MYIFTYKQNKYGPINMQCPREQKMRKFARGTNTYDSQHTILQLVRLAI